MRRLTTGLPLVFLVFLAFLAVPRVVVHDLRLLPLDSWSYKILAVGPLLIWLAVAVVRRVKQPVQTFLTLGLLFGLMLALTHQLTWDASWGANPPHLHGNLEGKLNPVTEGLVLRLAAAISSLVTGIVFGAPFALVALITNKLYPQNIAKN